MTIDWGYSGRAVIGVRYCRKCSKKVEAVVTEREVKTGFHDEVMCLDCGFTWNDYGGWSPKTWCRPKRGFEADWSGNRDPDFALEPMTAEAAAWVRKHAWNGVIRAEYKRAKSEVMLCACQVGASPSCEAGNHRLCHKESPHASAEAWVKTTRGYTAEFAEPFKHPFPWKADQRQEPDGWARLWLADRVCRWVCPCSCHKEDDAQVPARAPMTAEAAAWVREHVWTAAMRKTHREVPTFQTSCSCLSGPTDWCKNGSHGKCRSGETGLPAPETFITDKRERVLYLPDEFEYPTMTATGPKHTRAAQVWLADRICRYVCPCSCHEKVQAKTGTERVDSVELVTVEARPAAVAEPDALMVVVEQAGGRCQCERCPVHRRHQGGRCETEHGKVRLLAAPEWPGAHPDREPVVTDPAKLLAWCPPCYDEAVKRARKYERDSALLEASRQDSLF